MSHLLNRAARNNADWCDIVCRLQGLEGHLDERLWWTASRSPDFYPDAVTLHPGVMPDEVLAQPDLRLFLAADGDEVLGGFALNRSAQAVGVSNLFATGVDPALVWDDVAGLASRAFPGLPIVGYEAGDDLVQAQQAGFTPLGPLRIWIR